MNPYANADPSGHVVVKRSRFAPFGEDARQLQRVFGEAAQHHVNQGLEAAKRGNTLSSMWSYLLAAASHLGALALNIVPQEPDPVMLLGFTNVVSCEKNVATGLAAGGDGTVSVFHGSIDNGPTILRSGLDPARAPTFVSRDLAAARNALTHHPNATPGLGTIIESRIPAEKFEQLLAPVERPYSGFYPYGLNSSEITLRTPEQIQLFNNHIVRP
jgi:hypothetical protein